MTKAKTGKTKKVLKPAKSSFKELANSLSVVNDMLEVSSNFMCVMKDYNIVHINSAGVEMLGYKSEDDLVSKGIEIIFPLKTRADDVKAMKKIAEANKGEKMSVSVNCADNTLKDAILAVKKLPVAGEDVYILELAAVDMAKMSKGRTDIESFVLHDSVTGLPALPLFEDRLEMAIARATRAAHGKPENAVQLLVTFSVDMDKAKDIDMSYGKEAKDYILNTMSSRLVSSFRRVDTIARAGQEGFLIFLENINSFDDVEMIARRIMGLVKEGISYKNQDLALGCSIGISVFPYGAMTVEEMIKQANEALTAVKKKGGGGYAIYKVK